MKWFEFKVIYDDWLRCWMKTNTIDRLWWKWLNAFWFFNSPQRYLGLDKGAKVGSLCSELIVWVEKKQKFVYFSILFILCFIHNYKRLTSLLPSLISIANEHKLWTWRKYRNFFQLTNRQPITLYVCSFLAWSFNLYLFLKSHLEHYKLLWYFMKIPDSTQYGSREIISSPNQYTSVLLFCLHHNQITDDVVVLIFLSFKSNFFTAKIR